MLEYVWSCENSKLLGSGCQQHSNNLRSIMDRSDLGFICYIHELRHKKSGREWLVYTNILLPIVCSVQINSSIIAFLLLDKNMVNDVPENDYFDCLNILSSWRCGLWSPYNYFASPWTKFLFSISHCVSV